VHEMCRRGRMRASEQEQVESRQGAFAQPK
jgi:hypothetical protein